MSSWADLAMLRANGLAPGFPVVIATAEDRRTRELAGMGFMVVRHQQGEKFHVELLAGLRVWLCLGSCDRAQAVVRMANQREIYFDLQAWCECAKRMTSTPVNCATSAEWEAA